MKKLKENSTLVPIIQINSEFEFLSSKQNLVNADKNFFLDLLIQILTQLRAQVFSQVFANLNVKFLTCIPLPNEHAGCLTLR